MPMNLTQYAQLLILLLALPTQYFLTVWWGTDRESLRTSAVLELVSTTKKTLSEARSWLRAFSTYIIKGSMFKLDLKSFKVKKSKRYSSDATGSMEGECIAKEVFKYNDISGHFSLSTTVRSPRPKGVRFRVGQVIKHKIFGYRGVIVGWDEICNAPNTWMDTMHRGNAAIRKTPHYSVLVDKRDRSEIQTTYVAQENIMIISNMEIQHPSVWDYFNLHDGAQYHMRPAMHELYPHD